MSEENIGIKIIDCTKSCKMTRQVRGSDLCTGKARVVGSSIFYDCKEALAEKDRDQRQFFSCDLWDNGLEDSCFSCQLECSNNKNDKMAAVLAQKKELDDVIEKLKPNMVLYGVSAKQVSQISEKYTKKAKRREERPDGVGGNTGCKFCKRCIKDDFKRQPS